MLKILAVGLLCVSGLSLGGCEPEGPVEQAGEALDDAVDEVRDQAEDAGEEVEELVDESRDN